MYVCQSMYAYRLYVRLRGLWRGEVERLCCRQDCWNSTKASGEDRLLQQIYSSSEPESYIYLYRGRRRNPPLTDDPTRENSTNSCGASRCTHTSNDTVELRKSSPPVTPTVTFFYLPSSTRTAFPSFLNSSSQVSSYLRTYFYQSVPVFYLSIRTRQPRRRHAHAVGPEYVLLDISLDSNAVYCWSYDPSWYEDSSRCSGTACIFVRLEYPCNLFSQL